MHYLTVLLPVLPGLSIPLNIFLLFVIWTNRKVSSGYSGFLLITTIYTIFYGFSYVIFDTMIVNDDHGYTMSSLRLLRFGQRFSVVAAVCQHLLFCAGFIFSATHALYRFCLITGKNSFIFEDKVGVLCVVSTFFIYNMVWLCVVLRTQRNSNGIRWPDLCGAVALCLLSGTVFQLNAFTTYKIHKFVKVSVCSSTTRDAQAQLANILVAQLIVAAFTEIIPCTLVLWSGLVGLSFLCSYCTILSNLFPIFNVMIIVFLVKVESLILISYRKCSTLCPCYGAMIGVLVDVSGSMQFIYETGNNLTNERVSRIPSNVLQRNHKILKKELENDHENRIFAFAFGLSFI